MRQLHSEIEGAAKDKMHLQRKLLFLSEAGIDEETVTPIPKSVMPSLIPKVLSIKTAHQRHSLLVGIGSR